MIFRPRRLRRTAAIRDLVADGKSVILLGDTLDECIGMSTRVIVLKDGAVVEAGPAGQVLTAAQHPYTQKLLAAA